MKDNKALLLDAAARAHMYLMGVQNREVSPSSEALKALDRLAEPLPDAPQDAAETLALMDEIGSPATVASTGGRYFGFVVGGALPVSVASNWLATAWDQNSCMAALSPSVSALERIAGQWVVEALSLPRQVRCSFVTGTTTAHMTALSAARERTLRRLGWDLKADGLFGAPELKIVVGEEVHPSLIRALRVLGIGLSQVVRVPVDGQGRLRANKMPALDERTIVCAQAGNVNTGAFDPFDEICERAEPTGAWVHVDGAFGLWAAASPKLKHLTRGIEKADSWATDGHKWLNVPYDSGIALLKDPAPLCSALGMRAPYLVQDATRDAMDYTLEMSRRARGVDVWAALRTLGRSGLAELFERNCRQARRFADGLQAAGYEVLNEVVLNQVLVSFGPKTQEVIAALQQEGTCWCGGTKWQGRTAMRISVSSYATQDDDVEHALEAMLKIAELSAPTPRPTFAQTERPAC